MTLPLPPRSIIRPDEPTARMAHEQLTSIIAGHPQALTTYLFYEELDQWLGPWGNGGYPLGYGKFYNIAFTGNRKLMDNPNTQQWVWRTTIALQEALRDYVVARIRNGTLPALTEAELRQAAFDSHPGAYDRGGLAMVALVAPELIPVIATIPLAEFSPTSENFGPTVKQVFATLALIAPKMAGNSLAAAAGPAHTGILARAVQRDQRQLLDHMALIRELASVTAAINQGRLDHVPWLDEVIASLNAREFPDQGYARAAREVVSTAQRRRRQLVERYDQMLMHAPEVRSRVRRTFPSVLP